MKKHFSTLERAVRLFSVLLFVVMLIGSAAFPTSVRAGGGMIVNTLADNEIADGFCTLREAIIAANTNANYYGCAATGFGDDTITFSLSGTIVLGEALPTITTKTTSGTLKIDGAGQSITVSGNNAVSIFTVDNGAALTLLNLTVANANISGGGGGGVWSAGTLTVNNCTFSNNHSDQGGGISVSGGKLTVSNSTFSGNSANLNGGGIANFGTLTVTNSTFSGNSASGTNGGGISNNASATLINTIVANNTAGGNCDGAIINGGNNIDDGTTCGWGSANGSMSSTNPLMDGLGNNGGSAQTMALLVGSPAIDAGDNAACAAAPVNNQSQNGVTRPQDGNLDSTSTCDIGAYELRQPAASFGPISQWTSAFDLSHGWTVQNFVRTVGDVNKDGQADLVGFGADGVYVALSTGTGFGAISQWTSAFDLSHGWTVQDYVRTVGDVNNDGRADLIGFGADGVYVALSTGTGFGAVAQWSTSFGLANGWTVQNYVRTVGDVNNDGRADLIGFGLDGVYVALSTGIIFGAATRWSTGFDLSHGWTVQNYVRTVGDINNDGRADLIGFGADGVYVAISTGTAFGAVAQWSTGFGLANGWTVQSFVRTVGYVTGDGKADLVGFGADGVYVALSTGTGFSAISQWTSAFDLSHGWTVQDFVRTVGDVNNDGRADLVGFGADGVYVAIAQ